MMRAAGIALVLMALAGCGKIVAPPASDAGARYTWTGSTWAEDAVGAWEFDGVDMRLADGASKSGGAQ